MKITLLGDSIRGIGYGTMVPGLLGDDFEVFQPHDNGRFAKYTLRGIHDWAGAMQGSRIVHWNNGLWDICKLFDDGSFSSEQEYIDCMLRIAGILLERYEKVIFATTTPVNENHPQLKNADIERYNSIIVPVLEEKGIIINDLYTPVSADIDKYIRNDDNIHLTEEGIVLCSNQVAKVIRQVAESLD